MSFSANIFFTFWIQEGIAQSKTFYSLSVWINSELLPTSLLDTLSINIILSINPQHQPESALCLCAFSHSLQLIAHSSLCLAGLTADKVPAYNRSEVTSVLQSPQWDSGIIRAGCKPVIDRDVYRLPLTRDLVHYHLSPSLSITAFYHPALPAPLWLAKQHTSSTLH